MVISLLASRLLIKMASVGCSYHFFDLLDNSIRRGGENRSRLIIARWKTVFCRLTAFFGQRKRYSWNPSNVGAFGIGGFYFYDYAPLRKGRSK